MPKFAPLVTFLPLLHQGKTRDIHRAKTVNGTRHLLIVATNRLSTHNVVHKSLVPFKGDVLTCLTIFLLTEVLAKAGIPHHLVAYGEKIYDYLDGTRNDYPPNLPYHAIIVEEAEVVPIEFIFRAYLTGSLWTNFYAKGLPNPYGLELQKGLPLMHRFPDPIFTPTNKSDADEERNSAEVEALFPDETVLARHVFVVTRKFFNSSGLETLDAKFEIARDNHGNCMLVDEISPDSCRICDLSATREGANPPSKDKQIARDKAEAIWGDGARVPLIFEDETVVQLSNTYRAVFFQATGISLGEFRRERLG